MHRTPHSGLSYTNPLAQFPRTRPTTLAMRSRSHLSTIFARSPLPQWTGQMLERGWNTPQSAYCRNRWPVRTRKPTMYTRATSSGICSSSKRGENATWGKSVPTGVSMVHGSILQTKTSGGCYVRQGFPTRVI